jgi:hypothetical protein
VSVERLFAVAVVALVGAGVTLAFALMGSPSHARAAAFDGRRIADLARIAGALDTRSRYEGLPKSLPSDIEATDPQTGKQYQYRRIDAHRYLLCATFLQAGDTIGSGDWPYRSKKWKHGAGHACFTLHTWPDDS